MTPITAHALVQESVELFSLPDIYFQISQMIQDPRFSLEDIASVISKDPALSVRLLQVVNSSYYGFQAKIDTISRAIVVVGIDDLNKLILATSVIDVFSDIPSELTDMADFWMHSVHCGLLCKLLAKASSVLHSERLFLAGLLHNIGSLILYCKMPEQSQKVLLAADFDKSKIAGLEQEIIGFNHAQVGSELIKNWGLPESLYEAIACYLQPQLAQVHRLDAYLLFLATQLVFMTQQGIPPETVMTKIKPEGFNILRLKAERIIEVAEQAADEFYQIYELIAPSKKFH